jgi:muramoyltetrapeptide carboxypeptidase
MPKNPSDQPPILKPGDIVDIIAPSSRCNPMVLNQMRELLESWELRCHIPDDLFGDHLLYANTDEKRFVHLKNALFNSSAKVIWCLLGGYGASRLIPMLSKLKPPAEPKVLIGFSDITALHIFLVNHWGWTTIHGPSGFQACQNKVSSDSIEILKKILFNKNYSFSYEQITPLNEIAKKESQIHSSIIGGNLHLIQASLGTYWQINAQDKILFIEEINERAYRIDRILVQLDQAGILKQAKAILFGDFIDKGEPDGRFLVQDAVQEFADQCPKPVLQISNVGHGTTNNPILLGSAVRLRTGDHYSLSFN